MIKSINIIGSGNVATVLALHLQHKVKIKTIYSKSISHAMALANKIGCKGVDSIKKLDKNVDLTIVAIKDDALKSILKQIPNTIPIVHTSGSVNLSVFKSENYGIIYPLQTLSKNSKINLQNVPFLIEASSNIFEKELIHFCKQNLSNNYLITTSEQRKQIHLAAVISNNFLTALLVESEQILKNQNIDFNILKPLLLESINKAFALGAKQAQTGPAKRQDTDVIICQFNSIKNPELKKIYKLITELIQNQQSNL